MLGAPGSGKGTHSQRLTEEFGIPQISTGDIFRKNLKEKTPLGLKIESILASGGLVPDDITIAIVENRLSEEDCKNGFILDGFPRSVAQAEALEKFCKIDYALNLDVDRTAVISRLSGRRFCPDCNGTFHVSTLSDDKVCPVCGGKLETRKDDSEETVKNRLKVYDETTFPLIDFYQKRGLLVTVDGNGTIDEVYLRICKALCQ